MLGRNNDERDRTTDTEDLSHMDGTETSFATVGERNKKKRVAAGGVKLTPQKKLKNREQLLQYVGIMTNHLGSISKNMAESKTPPQTPDILTIEDVFEILKEHMRSRIEKYGTHQFCG